MRPDVAAAFDRMAAAARRGGISLLITSGFRSDAEQAELFEQNPDPTWVAPPGKSLCRCATELDLGPTSAYGWVARNAERFGLPERPFRTHPGPGRGRLASVPPRPAGFVSDWRTSGARAPGKEPGAESFAGPRVLCRGKHFTSSS